MAVTVGNASATIVTEGKGVYGMAPVGENGVSVKVGNDPWNTLEMTITKNENGEYTYTASFTGGSKYILDSAIFPDLWANDSYNLNAAQIEYLNNNYGLTLG
ncbi:MAG: hypothetical protein K2N72_04720 [Oscillospiraceae bacterium]|nr:hypothetical protein [Oscillospiraceae bacterium]